MKKVFLSLPMNGRTDEAIKDTMSRMTKVAESLLGEEVEIIDTFLEGADYQNKPLACLGESIKRMQEADLMIRLVNYDLYSRGCEVEDIIANDYGIPRISILDYHCTLMPDVDEKIRKERKEAVAVC